LSRSSRALGIPEGVFKTCPDGRHVMESQASVCPYCLEDQGGQSPGSHGGRNPVNALDQLRREALGNDTEDGPQPSDEAPPALMSTQVRGQVHSFRQAPAPAPVSSPPSPASAVQIANIGPEAAASDPYGTSTPSEPDGLSKTQPLAAIVSGDIKTHVMVAIGTQNPVLGWIRGLNGPVKGRSFDICHGRNILGSAASCSVVIPSTDIRPRHVSIMANEEGVTATLTDTASSLRVNGVSTQSQELVDGDLVELGPAAFRFRCLSEKDLTSSRREGT